MEKSVTNYTNTDDLIAEFIGIPVVFITLDRNLVYANKNARDLFEIGEETDISSYRCCDLLNLDICKAECPTKRIKDNGEVVYNYFVKRKNSEAVYCVSTSVICDSTGKEIGIIHSIKDMEMVRRIVEEQKRTQEELQLSQLKMQAILESIADGIFTVDINGEITHFSQSMEKIIGFSEEEVLGKSCRTVLRGNNCEDECPITWSLQEAERVETCKETIVTRDGKAIPVFITTSPIRENNALIGIVCSVNDRTEIENLRKELDERIYFPEIIGKSKRMLELFSLIESVSNTDVTALVEGETGTGKELVARAIHQRSSRNRGPFIPVNCSALSLFLLESELFGHSKGSFTGAIRDRKGKFEIADGGTLFLDEISEINQDIQLKLLRFLQSKEFERVGETVTRKVDVRIIAATNKNLKELVRDGKFREDLFYRLNVIPVNVPPLHERKVDIPLLIEHFLRKHRKLNTLVEGVSTRAIKNLIEYEWPGNVRELENAIMYAMASCPGKRIGRACLPPDIGKVSGGKHEYVLEPSNENSDLRSIEKQRIIRALMENNWKVDETAHSLGYSRITLWRRMKKLEIKLPNRNHQG